MKYEKTFLTRREALKRMAAAGVGVLADPMINRGSFRIFPNSSTEYSSRAIELVKRSTVIDMLSILTLDLAKQDKWMAEPDLFTAADIRPFKDSGIDIIHPAIGLGGINPYETALKWFAGWNSFIANHDEYFIRVDSPTDIERAKKS